MIASLEKEAGDPHAPLHPLTLLTQVSTTATWSSENLMEALIPVHLPIGGKDHCLHLGEFSKKYQNQGTESNAFLQLVRMKTHPYFVVGNHHKVPILIYQC